MATLLKVFQQEFDNDGLPLDGGKVYIYNHGTQTPSDIYQDINGTALSNPVILSSSGRYDIFVGSGLYDAYIYDSNNVLIDSSLGISGGVGGGTGSVTNFNTITELIAAEAGLSDLANVSGYYAAGDGKAIKQYYWSAASTATHNGGTVIKPLSDPATGRWLAVVGSVITPFNFGAIDDGVTLFASAQTMYDWAAANGVGTVEWDGDVFLVNQILHPSNVNTVITSQTTVQGSTNITAGQDIFKLIDVEHIKMNGGGLVKGLLEDVVENKNAISLRKVIDVKIDNIRTADTDGDGIYLGDSSNFPSDVDNYNYDVSITNVVCENHRRQGISVITAKKLYIDNVLFKDIGQTEFTDPGAGLDIEPDGDYCQLSDIHISNVRAENCAGAGIMIHLPEIDQVTEPNKKIDIHLSNINCDGNDRQGLRITSILSPYVLIEVDNLVSENNGMSGLFIGNVAFDSCINFTGVTKLTNNFTRSIDATFPFPYYFGGVNAETKVDFLLYSNTVSDWDLLYGSNGLLCGNVKIEKLFIQQDTIDIQPFWSNTYAGSSGSAYPTIRDVVVDELYIKTPSSKLPTFDNDYAYDIIFNQIFVYDDTNFRWVEANAVNTTNKTLSNDTDQNILNVNTGAVAVVKYTVPGAQAAADRQQRFKIENRETVGTIITLASGDYLVLEDGKQVSKIFTYTPYSRIEFEKKDVTYWQVTKMLGNWYYNDVVDVSDADYTVTQADNGKVLTDSSATADRTFSLPLDDAENTLIGFEVTLHNRSANYRMIIDPPEIVSPPTPYTILGLETSSGGRIQSGEQGSTITLKYTGGQTYCVVSKTGAWVDLDSTTAPINASRNIGNQFFSGYVQNSVTDSITASTTQTQGQGLLTTQNNFVTVCANANDTVTLPAAFLGMEVYIKNEGAQTLRVYPNTSAQINALGVNNPTTIAAGASATFRAKSTISWHT